jgi:hypothetical protein
MKELQEYLDIGWGIVAGKAHNDENLDDYADGRFMEWVKAIHDTDGAEATDSECLEAIEALLALRRALESEGLGV